MDYEMDYLDELLFDEPAEENDDDLLPAYLREPPIPTRTYGTLSYNRRSKCWTVKADPAVTEMCKRLFPGSAGSKRGEARFTAHRRMVGDLMWLMLRYPLEVSPRDRAVWDKAVQEARDHAIRKAIASKLPERMTPPEGSFTGELRPFQQEGLAFLMQHDRCLLADEMGLGKTVQALSYLASTDSFPALVIPPAHLTRNWTEEASRFLRIRSEKPRVHVIRGLKPYELPEADVYIMHYLLLRGWKEVLPTLGFKAVIFDEVQELRHTGTEKYSAASLLSESCERVIGLSGTPIYNTGGEIWNVINILDYHFLGDWESFSREWCYGYGNAVVVKPQLLGDYLRQEGLMLRRTKQEVLKELPPKRRAVQELDWNDKLYAQLMAPVLPDVVRWKTDGTLTASARAMLEESISQHVRQATGIAKAPYVCQFVRALLDSGEKVLLFAHHHAVMDAYKQELKNYRPGFITGRETISAKADAVERFMSGKTDVLCISLRAASGLNLQRATCVVFGELDWSPAVHSQAEDRAHRMGQEDSLLCYYLVAPQGSDAAMQEALGLKVSQFVGLMGDTPVSAAESAEAAHQARKHVEMIAAQMEGSSTPFSRD
ncbi:MAG: DEAD/DEAH box helicase [Clostridiales bacterium]|nr:DEAD/DEAH box helicase [Clostridiales bacterium]